MSNHHIHNTAQAILESLWERAIDNPCGHCDGCGYHVVEYDADFRRNMRDCVLMEYTSYHNCPYVQDVLQEASDELPRLRQPAVVDLGEQLELGPLVIEDCGARGLWWRMWCECPNGHGWDYPAVWAHEE